MPGDHRGIPGQPLPKLVEGLLLDIRQNAEDPPSRLVLAGPAARFPNPPKPPPPGWKVAVGIVAVVHPQPELPQVVLAAGAVGRLAHLLDGWQKQRDQDT